VLLDRATAAGWDGRAGATADEGEEAEAEMVSTSGSGWPIAEADDIVELRSRRTLSVALGAAVRVEPAALVSRVATNSTYQGTSFPRAFGETAWPFYIYGGSYGVRNVGPDVGG